MNEAQIRLLKSDMIHLIFYIKNCLTDEPEKYVKSDMKYILKELIRLEKRLR